MNNIQLACCSLIASAVVLAGLLAVNVQSAGSRAEANMVLSRDEYTFLTARTRTNEEALFVIDNVNQKLLVYTTTLKGRGGRMELARVEDLTRYFEVGGSKPPERTR